MHGADNESTRTLRTALDVLPFRVAILDSTGGVTQMNERWARVATSSSNAVATGGVGEEYLALLEVADSDVEDEIDEGIRSLLDGDDGVLSVEYPVGDQRDQQWSLLRATAFETDADRYVILACVDGIDQRQVSNELQLKERAMDEAPVGITMSDPQTEDNEIIYANDAFERITGYAPEEIIGRNCRFLQGADTDEESIARMRTAIEDEVPVVEEVLNYRSDGEEFWNEVTIAPLRDENGDVTHFVGFQRDVTARKKAQRELNVERDRLTMLNQLVRHDIRNDMAVILGWGDHLYERVSADQREDLMRVLDTARHTKQLTGSVRDLLALLDEDEPSLSAVPVDDVLREEIDIVRSSFEYRSDTVTISGDETLPDDIDVRATSLLSSVFSNVLNNAVFHNDKDEVEIDVSVEQLETTVIVRIADNGPGISDSDKRNVFSRGEKGLESAGGGLGLYLVDTLVSTYGGSVWIEDNEPAGAVFCVELQRA